MSGMEETETRLLDILDERQPTMDVSYEFISPDQYWERLEVALAGGEAPSVWNAPPDRAYRYAVEGQLADLTAAIERDFEMTMAVGGFYTASLEGFQLGNSYHGVPRDLFTLVVYYNSDLLGEAGVQPPAAEAEWTWADLLAAAEGVKESTEAWGCEPLYDVRWLDPLIWGNGGQPYGDDYPRDLQGLGVDLSDERSCSTVQFFVDLVRTHQVAPPPPDPAQGTDTFLRGEAALGWGLNDLAVDLAEVDFEWNVAPVPTGEVEHLTYGYSNGLVVHMEADQNAAWELALWMTNPGNIASYLTAQNAMPVLAAYAEAPDFFDRYEGVDMDAFVRSAEFARLPHTLGYDVWKGEEQAEYERALRGELAAEEACAAMSAAANAAITEIIGS
jgi:ABC-type glycerol-3-phosphate transport system substrate-binding protein